MKRDFAISGIGFVFGLFLAIVITPNLKGTEFEIYTNKDIYYIGGLTVTRESDELKLIFDNEEVLKEYISYQTANDIKCK